MEAALRNGRAEAKVEAGPAPFASLGPHPPAPHPAATPRPLPARQVSDDLLSTEFKQGLGLEAGADQEAGDDEGLSSGLAARPGGIDGRRVGKAGGGAAAPQWGSPKRPYAPRNLAKLLERRGLMLTKSAAKCVVVGGGPA